MSWERNTEGLKKGNTVNVGRKPSEFKIRRDECLSNLAQRKSEHPDAKTLHESAEMGLASLLAEGDGPTVRWYFDQQIGSPKTTIVQEIAETLIFEAFAEEMAEMGMTEDQAKELTTRVVGRLKGE
jgi:hypothetical protein